MPVSLITLLEAIQDTIQLHYLWIVPFVLIKTTGKSSTARSFKVLESINILTSLGALIGIGLLLISLVHWGDSSPLFNRSDAWVGWFSVFCTAAFPNIFWHSERRRTQLWTGIGWFILLAGVVLHYYFYKVLMVLPPTEREYTSPPVLIPIAIEGSIRIPLIPSMLYLVSVYIVYQWLARRKSL